MNTALILRAARFAAEKHKRQRRKDVDGSPYIHHPLEVALVLAAEGGVEDPETLAAALLHDTLEDTATTPAELVALFGEKVAGIVGEVSDDKRLPKAVRKEEQVRHAPELSAEAKLVKLADKISNMRDILAFPPADWSSARRQEYFDWAFRVIAGVRGAHPVLEGVFDEVMARRDELG
jgi:guanosine-3',5'-bis(diphosphate) 3'-pyrophosphohydrolase